MRTIILGRLLPVLLLATLTACGSSVNFVRLDPVEYPPKAENAPIEVHQGSVMTPHVVIGVITAEQAMQATTGSLSTYDEVLAMMKRQARRVGGDALIEVKPIYAEDGRLDTNVQLTAKIVRFLEKQTTVATR